MGIHVELQHLDWIWANSVQVHEPRSVLLKRRVLRWATLRSPRRDSNTALPVWSDVFAFALVHCEHGCQCLSVCGAECEESGLDLDQTWNHPSEKNPKNSWDEFRNMEYFYLSPVVWSGSVVFVFSRLLWFRIFFCFHKVAMENTPCTHH